MRRITPRNTTNLDIYRHRSLTRSDTEVLEEFQNFALLPHGSASADIQWEQPIGYIVIKFVKSSADSLLNDVLSRLLALSVSRDEIPQRFIIYEQSHTFQYDDIQRIPVKSGERKIETFVRKLTFLMQRMGFVDHSFMTALLENPYHDSGAIHPFLHILAFSVDPSPRRLQYIYRFMTLTRLWLKFHHRNYHKLVNPLLSLGLTPGQGASPWQITFRTKLKKR